MDDAIYLIHPSVENISVASLKLFRCKSNIVRQINWTFQATRWIMQAFSVPFFGDIVETWALFFSTETHIDIIILLTTMLFWYNIQWENMTICINNAFSLNAVTPIERIWMVGVELRAVRSETVHISVIRLVNSSSLR